MDEGFDKAVQIANHKHDLIAIRVTDKRETEIPDAGLVRMKDAETGEIILVDTGNKYIRDTLKKFSLKKTQQLDTLFSKTVVDMVKVYTGEDYVQPLMNMFKKRESRK
jgi:hypothetical protein